MVAGPLKKYWSFARPFTLVPPLLGIISGAVCAFGSAHNPDPARRLTLSIILTVALGSLCASFLNAASNIINQIYDLEIDRKNKPQRPLITGAISLKRGSSGPPFTSPPSSPRSSSCPIRTRLYCKS